MIIFILLITILLLILFSKIKVKIFLTINNLEYYYNLELSIYKFKILKIDKKDVKKYIKRNKEKINKNKKKTKNKKILKMLKAIKVEQIYIEMKIGLLEVLATTYVIPIISTAISILYTKLKLEKSKATYKIEPAYNQLKVKSKIETTLTTRPINLLIAYLTRAKT